jgi:hypothetical protein
MPSSTWCYGTFIVLFDSATGLPAVVRTRDFDVIEGDSNYDQTTSDPAEWDHVPGNARIQGHRGSGLPARFHA